MELLDDRVDVVPPSVSVAAAIGVFDGVHLGHIAVLDQVRSTARRLDVASAVVTFDIHPAYVVRPENAPKLLTTLEQKLELLEQQELDYAYVIHFDEARANTRPDEFVEQVFHEALHARAIVVGSDFHFGKGRSGDVAELERLGHEWGFAVQPIDLVRHDPSAPEPVSSTAIRRALAGGDVEGAAELLGRDYEVRGTVQRGDRRGHMIGFPTANIPVPKVMAWPADAVYAGWCTRADGTRYGCAINIGRRPTFYEHAEQSLLEAHLIDFDDDLYGEEVKVEFASFVRSEHKFAGIDELAAQLAADVDLVRTRLGLR